MPRNFTPQSEGSVMRTLLIYAAEFGCRLFRNARGVERIAQKDCKSCQRFGRIVSYGLHNGAPDLIGWMPVTVTTAMVGQQIAVFVGVEVKREQGGTLSEEQRAFLAALERDGAIQGVARSIADLDSILGKQKETT